MTFTDRIGWTLLHFLWEGAVIALVLAVARAFLRRNSAAARYAAASAAMLLMAAALVMTFVSMVPSPAAAAHRAAAIHGISASIASATGLLRPAAPRPWLPMFVYVWFAGVCALAARSTAGWIAVQRFRARAQCPAGPVWQERLTELARRLS